MSAPSGSTQAQVVRADVEVRGPEGAAPQRFPHKARPTLAVEARVAVYPKEQSAAALHVVHLDQKTRIVSVLLEGAAAERLPAAPAWLVLPSAGEVLVVGAARPLGRKELAELTGGREPDMAGARGGKL